MNLNSNICNDDDLNNYVDKYSNQNNMFDYKRFVTDIKNTEVNLDDIHNQP